MPGKVGIPCRPPRVGGLGAFQLHPPIHMHSESNSPCLTPAHGAHGAHGAVCTGGAACLGVGTSASFPTKAISSQLRQPQCRVPDRRRRLYRQRARSDFTRLQLTSSSWLIIRKLWINVDLSSSRSSRYFWGPMPKIFLRCRTASSSVMSTILQMAQVPSLLSPKSPEKMRSVSCGEW